MRKAEIEAHAVGKAKALTELKLWHGSTYQTLTLILKEVGGCVGPLHLFVIETMTKRISGSCIFRDLTTVSPIWAVRWGQASTSPKVSELLSCVALTALKPLLQSVYAH